MPALAKRLMDELFRALDEGVQLKQQIMDGGD